MGTRHQQIVIAKNGDVKISQYGQWDGYPGGQGIEILRYLLNGNLDKYQENLIQIPLITDAQLELVEKDDHWTDNYPYLSRDCGSNIHQLIEDGVVEFVSHIDNVEADKWCEGFYTIDFSKNEFTTKYHDYEKTYSLDNLPTEDQYLKDYGE